MILALSFGLLPFSSSCGTEYESKKAALLVEETVTICGTLAQIVNQPEFERLLLNLGDAYPNEDLAFVVQNLNRKEFDANTPDLLALKGSRICATGTIIVRNRRLKMNVTEIHRQKN